MSVKIGVIGGSGLYDLEGIENKGEVKVETPYGDPSDTFFTGTLDGTDVVFVPRHARSHIYLPTEVPYKANIWALKKLGVTHIVTVTATGSLQEQFKPGDICVIDQMFDRTRHRADTFFGEGIVAHVAFADPIASDLAKLLYDTGVELGYDMHPSGTYVNMEGPQFSTRAESEFYRAQGFHVIGMTNYTEARLAREAEIPYATLALVTDYDCWKSHDESVDATAVLEVMKDNIQKAKDILRHVIPTITMDYDTDIQNALAVAIVTDFANVPEQTKQNLAPIIGRYLK
ncbi:MAG: S-methyl-5'-thioadenosine phosphorylase [Candidatus Lernaella stagnicola]|nr:S-methyl-5'-thioadenosine phosphorylase [Candidatus Lernaella stagnicola]